ncbi:MAG: selenium cofactor biosynthesis protein YqeC [Sphaerochaetaceae bacterium]|jgi:probable selenium-dependent hydroxylase accessory protein YqeC|nr:selenium cofactor biosynthesis protein YqeC [Sphaerochaetaceae bacterium]MDD3162469.1 selenium cofactor biosynthesis protein YqeC [Sphaerochaetaceae bacterium]MDD4008021.1 selenium cofactor biosynthesis protein YqeC [Sphaerochaetaceae bacterium]MDD4396090.1 selenium cofactor biosynthesis protein YqeC [Sphaerochaetaceae bacterium]
MRTELLGFLDSYITGGLVSITGSGGKTSLLIALAQHEKAMGKSVLITTTTKLGAPHLVDYQVNSIYLDDRILKMHPSRGSVDFLAYPFSSEKVCCPDLEVLSDAIRQYDIVLCEADGARHMPLKLHRDNEPVVLDQTSATIAIAGIGNWGKTVSEENFFNCTSAYDGRIIDEKLIGELMIDQNGILKNAKGRTLVLANQAEGLTVDFSHIRKYFGSIYASSIKENWIELQ